jgi:hypothetical protein
MGLTVSALTTSHRSSNDSMAGSGAPLAAMRASLLLRSLSHDRHRPIFNLASVGGSCTRSTLPSGIGILSPISQAKSKQDRPFATPEAAAKEMLRIFRTFIAAKNDPTVKHTYAGITNHEFVWVSGGSVEEWSLGVEFGRSQGWFTIDGGGRVFVSE